jgi:ADP-heptose:LPS heptosyltransferase
MRLDPHSFRKRRSYLLALGTEVIGPLLKLFARLKRTGEPTSPSQWRKGLMLGANHIGDILYRTAALAALRKNLPNCEWDFIAPPPGDVVLHDNPFLRKVLARSMDHERLRSSDGFFQELKAENYDVAICYDAAGYGADLWLVTRLGIPNVVAYTDKGLSGWVTHPVSVQRPQPYPAYFRDLVAQVTGGPSEASLRPQVYLNSSDRAQSEEWQRRHGLSGPEKILACFVTTRQPTTIWPRENFIRLWRDLEREGNWKIVLCGSAADRETLLAFQAEVGPALLINAGELNLRSLVCFLENCAAVLTSDSGPRHLANAAGVPVFFFRNLRSNQVETGPYLETETDLVPAGEYLLPPEQHQLLSRVTPAEVLTRLKAGLVQP